MIIYKICIPTYVYLPCGRVPFRFDASNRLGQTLKLTRSSPAHVPPHRGRSRSIFPISSKSAAGAFHIDACCAPDVQHAASRTRSVDQRDTKRLSEAHLRRRLEHSRSKCKIQERSHELQASAIRGSGRNVRVILLNTADAQSFSLHGLLPGILRARSVCLRVR